jgi:hypothetical protein
MRKSFRFVLIAAALSAACASGGTGGAGGGSSERNRITAEQLARVTASNAYDAIRILQPQWLDSRGVTSSAPDATPTFATVYQDGSRVGGLDYLRNINLNVLAEIRYLPPGEASARFGMGHDRGVIELISKGR